MDFQQCVGAGDGEVGEDDVAVDGWEVASEFAGVVELEPDEPFEGVDVEVADADVFDGAAAVEVALEADGGGAGAQGVVGEVDVADAAGHLAAEGDAVLASHVVVADDDVAAGSADVPAVLVAS